MEDIVIKSETLIKENEKATSNINNDLLSDNRQLQSNILSSTPFSQAGNLTGNLGDIAVKKEPIVDGNEKVEVKNENEETNTDFNSQFEILGSVITFKDEDTLMEVPQFLNNENICQSNLLSAQIPPSIEKGAMYEKVMCPSNLSSEQTPPLEEERALVVHPLKKTKIIYENLRKLLSTRHFSHKDVPLPSNISENTLNSNTINRQTIDTNRNAITSQPKDTDFVKSHSIEVTGTVSNESLSTSDQTVQPHILKPRPHVVKRIIRFKRKPDSNINVNDDEMNKIDYNDSCHHGQSDIVVSSVTAAPHNLPNLQGVIFKDCNPSSDVPLPSNISENTLNSNAINSQPIDRNSNAGQDFVKTHSVKVTGTVITVSNKSLSASDQRVQPHILKPRQHVVKRIIRYIQKPDSNVNDDKMNKIDYNDSCHHGQSDIVVSSVTAAPQNLQNLQGVNFKDCNQCSNGFSCEKNKNDRTRDIPLTVNTVNNFQIKFNGKWEKQKEPFKSGVLGNLRKKADHLATCKVGNQTCLIMRDMNSVASFGDFSMSECAKELNTMTPEEVPVQRNITTDVQYVQTHERLDPQFKDQYSLNVAKGHGKQISTKLSDVPITVSTSPATKGGESSNFINNHKASIRVQNNELAFIGKQDDSELQSAGIVSEVSVVDSLMNHISKVRSIAADLQMNTSSENAQKAPLKTFQPKAPRLTLDPTGVRQTSISSRHVSLTLPANYYDQNKTANETPSSSTLTPRGFIVVLPVKNGQKKVLFFPIGTTSTTTNREAPVLTAPPRSDQNTTTSTIQNMASGNALTAKYDDQEQKIMQLESDKSEKTVLTLKKSNFSLCPSVRTTMAVTQVSSIVSTMGPSTKLLNLAPVDSRKYLPRPYFQKSGPTVHTMYPPTRPNNSASVLSTAFLPSRTQSSTQYDGKNSIQTDIPYSTQTDKQNLTPRVSTSSRTPVKVPFNEAMNLINAKSWDTVPMITTPVSKELVRDSTSTRSESSTMPESTGSIFPLVIFPNVAASQNKGNDLQQGESTHNNVSQSGESIHNNVPQSGVSQVSYLINLMPKLKSTHQSLHFKVQPSNLASNYTHNPVIVTKNSHMSNASVPANTGEREKERILWTKQQTGVSAIDQMQPVPEGHLISKGDNCMNAFANIEKDPTQSHNTEIKVEPHDKEYLQTEICRPEVVIENVEGNDYYQLYNDNKGKSISHTKSCSSSEGRLLEKTNIKEEFVPMEKNSVVFENIPTESIGSQHLNINSGLFYSSETESCPSDNGIYPSDDEICQSGMDICPSVKDICPLVKDICPLVQNIGSAVQNIGLSNTITNVDYVDSSLLLRNFPFGKDCEEEGNIAEVLKEPADHRINLIKNQLLQWKDVQGENKMQIPCSGETIARLFDNRQQQSTQDIYVCKVKQEPVDETDIVSQLDPEPLNNTASTDSVHNENTCLEGSEQNTQQLDNVDSGHNENTILKESEQNTQQLNNVVEIKQEIPMEPDEPIQQIPEPLDINLPPVVHETEEPPMETEKAVQQIPEPLNTNLSPGAAPLSTPGLTQLVITPVYELIDGKIQIKLCLKPLENVLNPKENQEDNFVSVPLVSGPTTDKEGTESSSNTQGSQKNKEKKTKVQNSRGGGILPNILSSNLKVKKKVSSDTCMKVKKKVSSNMKVKKKEKGNRNKYGQYVKRCEKMLTRKKKQNEDPEMEMENVCDAVNENETNDLDTTLIESNTVERGEIQHKKENRSVINWDVDLACLEELQTSEEEKQLIDSDNVDSAEIQHRREGISLNNSNVFDRREDRLHMNPDIDIEVIKHTEEDNLYTDSEEIQHRREKNKSLKVFDVDNREEGSSLVDSDVFDRSKDRTLLYSEIFYKEDIGHKIKDRSLIDSDIVDPEKVQHRTEHKLLTDSDIVDSKEVQNKGDIRSLKESDIVDSEDIQPGTEDTSLMDSDIVDSENIQYPKENETMIDSDIVYSKEVQHRTKNT
ncbi:Hypothetical predicted protein [Mytilus galloprovincialis]|uniref:Uncharacterized protein n=1 Tax=Mytilus galloprovincialis TaxID=29158 RepID=A0A8B6DRM7_MYTGA|nr:Hypothetical predicted protein [Mytilus galloprovincialis]